MKNKKMNLKDLQEFFSQTHEFKVKELSADTYEISCEGESITMYQPTLQQLIRVIHQLGYNKGYATNRIKSISGIERLANELCGLWLDILTKDEPTLDKALENIKEMCPEYKFKWAVGLAGPWTVKVS